MARFWFLIDTTHQRTKRFRQSAVQKQLRNFPLNVLSVVLNDDATQALIKIGGIEREEFSEIVAAAPDGLIVETYDEIGHWLAVNLLEGPEWSHLHTLVD